MQFDSWRECYGYVVKGYVSDREIMAEPRQMSHHIRSALASAIVDRIMERLWPQIDEAITASLSKWQKGDDK